MAIPILKLKHDGSNFYSPLSGKAAFGKNGPNARDPDLLFVFVGNAGDWSFASKEVSSTLQAAGKDLESLDPPAVCRFLKIPGAVCLEVDSGWNGINWAAWKAPASE